MATRLRSSLFKKAGVSTEVTLFLTTRAGYVGADNCFAPSSVCCLEWYSRNYWGAPLCINLNGRCSWEGHLQNCGEGKADFYMWEGCKLIHLGGETVTIFQNGGTMSSFHCDITETLETVCSLWVCLACDCSRDACQWCHVSGDANLVFSGCSHHWAVRQPSSPGGGGSSLGTVEQGSGIRLPQQPGTAVRSCLLLLSWATELRCSCWMLPTLQAPQEDDNPASLALDSR